MAAGFEDGHAIVIQQRLAQCLVADRGRDDGLALFTGDQRRRSGSSSGADRVDAGNDHAGKPLAESMQQIAETAVEQRIAFAENRHVPPGFEFLGNERRRLVITLIYRAAIQHTGHDDGNFLLVRFVDAEAAFTQLLEAGVVVRDIRAMPQLGDALRISIGTPDECRRVLAALDAAAVGAAA